MLLFVSCAGEPSAEEKEMKATACMPACPPPYATVIPDLGAGGYRSTTVLYLFIIKAMRV
jgi:hypothetical protein